MSGQTRHILELVNRGIFYVVEVDLLTTTSFLGERLVALSACACTVAQLQVQSMAYTEARNDPLFILLFFSSINLPC